VLDWTGEAPGLDGAQRLSLLEDVTEDLDALIDDAENRGIGERGAREMIVIRALVGWLRGGEPPGAEAIGYLERAVGSVPRDPHPDERARRDVYLAAIAELGGDAEAASRLWRDDPDERARALLSFQGRKLRGRMEELGMSIGELGGRSRIDTVSLVAILFGVEEMKATQWLHLSEALGVPLEWMLEGIRFVPRTDPEGRGYYEIEPEPDVSVGGADQGERPEDDEPGDAR